jgi:hypothetical protein
VLRSATVQDLAGWVHALCRRGSKGDKKTVKANEKRIEEFIRDDTVLKYMTATVDFSTIYPLRLDCANECFNRLNRASNIR